MILFKNVTILDGTGAPARPGDVLVQKDKIEQVGQLRAPADAVVIDGGGKLLTPGFIDVHTHSDLSMLYCNIARGHIFQGVTSEVTGNCGFSPFPLREDGDFVAQRRTSLSFIDIPGVGWDWHSWPEYRERLQKNRLNENVRVLMGYGSLRSYVMGYENRRPSEKEEEQILALLTEALEQGMAGLSIGLGYAPDFYADTQELIRAAEVVRRFGRIFAYHIRGERLTLFRAVNEVIEIALASGVKTEISHLKCAGKHNMGRMEELLELVESGVKQGGDITFDLYPYEAGSSYLGLVFPPKYHEGGLEKLLARLEDPEERQRILFDMEHGYPGWSTFIGEYHGENLRITSAPEQTLIGKTLAQLGQEWGTTPYEAAARVMVECRGKVEMVMFQCDQGDVDRAAGHPLGMFGSDSLGIDPETARVRSMPHPRYYGAFSTILERYGRTGAIPLEQLIHKMTGLAAERFGLEDRGVIRPGCYGDLCLFSLEEIRTNATYEHPHALSQGMTAVLVNGEFVVRDGKATGATPGRVL